MPMYFESDFIFNPVSLLYTSGARIMATQNNTSATIINTTGYDLARLALGDFNGDGKTDLFRADGGKWYVSTGGIESWKKINQSGIIH